MARKRKISAPKGVLEITRPGKKKKKKKRKLEPVGYTTGVV